MSNIRQCTTCGRFDEITRHKCPPIFEVQRIDEDPEKDEWSRVHALDEEDAAMEWADRDDSDSAEYSIANGTPEKVRVRRHGEASFRVFRVHGEYTASYSAEEIEESSIDQESRES